MDWRFSTFLLFLFALLFGSTWATSQDGLCHSKFVLDVVALQNKDGALNCLDFWLNRYQTLVAGTFAIVAAIVALFQLDASRTQTKAAVDQVGLGRIALETTERAFVTLEPFEHEWLAERETEKILGWNFQAIWKNVGNTPTKFMTNNMTSQVLIDDLAVDSDFADGNPAGVRKLWLGPGSEALSSKFYFENELLAGARSGEVKIYLWGWAEYNDVFQCDRRHRTEFCVRINVFGDPEERGCAFGYEVYGPFNGIDEECLRRPKACKSWPNDQHPAS